MARPWSANELRVLNSYLSAGFDLSRSVVLHIPYPALPLNEESVITAIKTEMPSHKLTGIDRPGVLTIWILHFEEALKDRSKLKTGLIHVLGDHQLMIRDFDVAKTVQINVHQISSLTANEVIASYFSRFGEVKHIMNNKTKTGLMSSSRRVIIEVKDNFNVENVPDFPTINNQHGFCVTIGKDPLCLRCKQRGHISRSCKAVKCGKCGKYTHTTDNCNRGTFADKVRGPQTPTEEEVQDPVAINELDSIYEEELPNVTFVSIKINDVPVTSTPLPKMSPPPVPARSDSSKNKLKLNTQHKTMLGESLDFESGEVSTDTSTNYSPMRKKVLIDSSNKQEKETHTLVRKLSKIQTVPSPYSKKQ